MRLLPFLARPIVGVVTQFLLFCACRVVVRCPVRTTLKDEKFDTILMSIAKECNGIDDILNAYFGFLRRKTDFFGHMDRAQVAIDNQMKQQAAQYEREIAAEEAARKAKAAAAAAAAATAATASPPKGPSCTVSVPLRTGVIRSDSHGGTESMGGSGGRRQPVSPVHFFVRVCACLVDSSRSHTPFRAACLWLLRLRHRDLPVCGCFILIVRVWSWL